MLRKKEMIALAMVTTLFASCAQDENLPQVPQQGGRSEFYQFSLQANPLVGDAAGETINTLHAYAYAANDTDNGTLLKTFEDISMDASGDNAFTLQLPSSGEKKLYFLANASPLADPVTTESEIREAVMVSTGTESADMFYSLEKSINGGSDATLALKLIRGVARIDVNAGDDANVAITKITYSGGSDRTYAFMKSNAGEAVVPSANVKAVNYEHTFTTPLQGGAGASSLKEAVFYVYENGTHATTVTIEGTYNGAPMTPVVHVMPALSRNSKYTVKLVQMGQQVSGTVEIAPWGNGGEIPVNPVK